MTSEQGDKQGVNASEQVEAASSNAQSWIPVSTTPSSCQHGLSSNRSARSASAVPTPDHRTPDYKAVRDVETGAIVHCPARGRGRAVVEFEDGVTITRHSDGTTQRWHKGRGRRASTTESVLVECAGFPSVEVGEVRTCLHPSVQRCTERG